MIQLMESNVQGERFIITSENVSYKNFFSWITETLGVKRPSIPLPSSFANVGWIVSSLLYKTLGIYPILTRETARTVNGVYHYSNRKIIERINYQFKPAKEFVTETALQFKKDFYQVV
jgi:dihydroflavonol-4-reductase